MYPWEEIEDLARRSVPRPDGTALGNLRHTLAVHSKLPDDVVVLTGTRHVYEQGEITGLTLGDLRALLAMIGERVPPTHPNTSIWAWAAELDEASQRPGASVAARASTCTSSPGRARS